MDDGGSGDDDYVSNDVHAAMPRRPRIFGLPSPSLSERRLRGQEGGYKPAPVLQVWRSEPMLGEALKATTLWRPSLVDRPPQSPIHDIDKHPHYPSFTHPLGDDGFGNPNPPTQRKEGPNQ